MKTSTICVLGGSGFVGGHLCAELVKRGHNVKILTRRRERHRSLLVLPTVQIIESDVHGEAQLNMHFAGCDVVINLVGILNEKGHKGKGFHAAHMELTRKVITACTGCKIERLLHMSALNANPNEKSFYLRTKGEAENYAHTFGANRIAITSFRPSVIFGPEDDFLNRFASVLKFTPWLLPLACAETRFAPVYVGDVVKAMVGALDDPSSFGQKIDLCGPSQYTLKQLVEYVASTCGYQRKIIGLPNWLSKLQARILEYAPGKPFSLDNYYALQKDNICRAKANCSTALEAVAPGYLLSRSRRVRYYTSRTKYNR